MLSRRWPFVSFKKQKAIEKMKRKEMEKFERIANTLKKENPAMFRLTFLISQSLRSVN